MVHSNIGKNRGDISLSKSDIGPFSHCNLINLSCENVLILCISFGICSKYLLVSKKNVFESL